MNNKDTRNLENAIQQSLSQEDQEFLASLEKEPNYMDQLLGLYEGRLGWVSWLTTVGMMIMAIVMIVSFYQFKEVAPDIEGMLKYLGISGLCALGISLSKLWAALHLHTNRVLRELKKLELQIASLNKD